MHVDITCIQCRERMTQSVSPDPAAKFVSTAESYNTITLSVDDASSQTHMLGINTAGHIVLVSKCVYLYC